MPTSAIARMASGCTRVASVPALATSKRSPASERSSPSAIWLRAELWVHRNSTRCLFTSHLPCSLDRASRSRAQCRPATEVVVAVTTTQQFTLARRVTAESVGTALLLAAVVGSGMMGERLAGGNVAVALLANTLATGAALVALILTFGPISGAHFNPAVTLADAWQGGRPWGEVPAYVGAQVVGAFVGVAAAHVMFEAPLFSASRHARAGAAQLFSEFVATFGLLAVVWGCARASKTAVPFAVAAYITAAYWFTASTSFANPAVTLARAASDTFAGIRPADAPGFVVAQLLGAAAATALMRWLVPSLPREAKDVVVPHDTTARAMSDEGEGRGL